MVFTPSSDVVNWVLMLFCLLACLFEKRREVWIWNWIWVKFGLNWKVWSISKKIVRLLALLNIDPVLILAMVQGQQPLGITQSNDWLDHMLWKIYQKLMVSGFLSSGDLCLIHYLKLFWPHGASTASVRKRAIYILVQNWIFDDPFHKNEPALIILVPGTIQSSRSESSLMK